MATHGKAREITIASLRSLTPFSRSGFAMKAIKGASSTIGRLADDYADLYRKHRSFDEIAYTVLSYSTPIAWVLKSGTVIQPGDKYSLATTHHQSLCSVYLNK